MIWAIGNGESRMKVNINALKGPKIGCNGIYRDWHVDELVCVDRTMVHEALSNKYKGKILTKEDYRQHFVGYDNVSWLPKPPSDLPFSSGNYALIRAAGLASISDKEVHMIGYDMYSYNGYINNIYSGTQNYAKKMSQGVNELPWIEQAADIMSAYPRINFIVYQEERWLFPQQWTLRNVFQKKVKKLKKINP